MNSSRESVPDYLNKNIFPTLLSAMEEMLIEADRRNVLEVRYFYFLDIYIAEMFSYNQCARRSLEKK